MVLEIADRGAEALKASCEVQLTASETWEKAAERECKHSLRKLSIDKE